MIKKKVSILKKKVLKKKIVVKKTSSAKIITKSQKKITKPWGHEIIWSHCEKFVGKLLCAKDAVPLIVEKIIAGIVNQACQ